MEENARQKPLRVDGVNIIEESEDHIRYRTVTPANHANKTSLLSSEDTA